MVVTFRNYEEGDVYRLDLRDGDVFGEKPNEYPGPAWTMLEDSKEIACGGVFDTGNGVGFLWMYVTDSAKGHGISLFHFAKKALDLTFEVLDLHRVQTVVRTDKPEYIRWAKMFEFKKEGLMRKATAGKEDLYLFARTI